MTTFADVVDRVFRDWLHGPDEQPVSTTLTTAVTASATTFALELSTLTADEVNLLAPGTIVEVDFEQVLILGAASTGLLTVARAYNGTDAASHAEDARVTLLPAWGRQTVLDAVLDEVPRLYPTLFSTATQSIVATSGAIEVPATVETITAAWYASGSTYSPVSLSLVKDFSPSSTGKAVFVKSPSISGRTIYMSYRGGFDRPADGDVTLADASVDTSWIQILAVGATAAVIASEDVDKATVEFVTRQLEASQFPVGSSARLRDGLLRYREYLLNQARASQLATTQATVLRRSVTYMGV